jgi:hypothetical protein
LFCFICACCNRCYFIKFHVYIYVCSYLLSECLWAYSSTLQKSVCKKPILKKCAYLASCKKSATELATLKSCKRFMEESYAIKSFKIDPFFCGFTFQCVMVSLFSELWFQHREEINHWLVVELVLHLIKFLPFVCPMDDA